jgi:hypothetical protein
MQIQIFGFSFGRIRHLRSIGQIEATTKKYMRMPLEELQQEHQKIMEITENSDEKRQLTSEIYTALSKHKKNHLAANSVGVGELQSLREAEAKYQSVKDRLLGAARQ